MPQFLPQVPDPWSHRLPALLSPGRMAAPSVRIDLRVFIRERRLKGTTMHRPRNHIAGREGVLRQVREEAFVDHAFSGHSNGALLRPFGMCGYDHAAGHAIWSHRDFRTIGEAAHHLRLRTLRELIGRQMQTGLKQRVIEQAIVFASGHQRKTGEIGEDRSIALRSVESEQRAFW